MPDVDPALETSARRAFARLGSSIAVPAPPASPPEGDDGHAFGDPRPAGAGRRRLVLAAAASVALVGAGAGVVAVATDDDPDDAGLATAPADGAACPPRRAQGDVIDRGRFPDGVPWQVTDGAGTGGDEWVEGAFASIDGEGAGGWTNHEDSWPMLVDEGNLTWQLAVSGDHQLVYGQVPTTATRVEATLAGGTTVAACPVDLPSVDAVRYFALPLPPGGELAEGRALDAQGRPLAEATPAQARRGGARGEEPPVSLEVTLDRALVPLPLGGEPAPRPTAPALHDVVTGELPSGRWALRLGADGDDYTVEFVEPGRIGASGSAGSLDQLLGADHNWNVDSTDGRHLVWGLTAPEVATVRVTLDDGATVDVATVPPGIDAMPARAFAAALPEARHVTALDGLTAEGEVFQRAVDVESGTAPLATFAPDMGVGLLVERTE